MPDVVASIAKIEALAVQAWGVADNLLNRATVQEEDMKLVALEHSLLKAVVMIMGGNNLADLCTAAKREQLDTIACVRCPDRRN